MVTYQVRKRKVRLLEGETVPSFPVEATIRLHLLPEQPFGASAEPGRTARRGVGAIIRYDTNSGQHSIKSGDPLDPIDVRIEEPPKRTVSFSGRVLEVRSSFDTFEELVRTLEWMWFAVPWLLTVPFADPPYAERLEGEIDGVGFQWELTNYTFGFETTTQEEQEGAAAEAWLRMVLLQAPHRRRLITALHYLHVACRLSRESKIPGEFMAETLLNFAKTLEVLFPGAKTIDSARAGLREFGYTDREIEARFVPVIALRNQIDVGHVHLAIFDRSQLTTLHEYVDTAEGHFRGLLERVLSRIEKGEWDVPEYDSTPRPEALQVIDRMAKALRADGPLPRDVESNPS